MKTKSSSLLREWKSDLIGGCALRSTFRFSLSAFSSVLLALSGATGFAANFTNTTSGNQTWNTPANWGGTVASGAGNTALINPTPPATATMTLDIPVTIGTISVPSANIANVINGTNTFTMNGTGGSNIWGVANEAGIGTGANASGGTLVLQSGVSIEMATNLSVGNTNGGPDLTIQGNITNSSGGALTLNLRNNNTGNAGQAPGHLTVVSGSIGATGSQINIQNLSAQSSFSATCNTTLSGPIGGVGGAVVTVTNASPTSIANFIISGNLGDSVTTVTQNSLSSRMILSNATNSYTGQTTISAGALQANDGAGLPTGSFLSLDGGVLQSNSATAFSRGLAASGASNFQFTANGGGFSANGGQLTVNIGGGAALQWGTTVGTNIVGNFRFGSVTANNKTLFQNAIDLNGADRTILVTAGSGGDSNEISGIVSNSTGAAGLNVVGGGTLLLSNAANTYNGNTSVAGGGALVLTSLGGSGRTITVGTNSLVGAGAAIDNAFLGRIVQGSNAFTIGLGASSANNLDLSGFTNASLGATSAATFSGALTPDGQAYRLGGGSANLTISSNLADNITATSLTKTGSNVVVLGGANIYTGNTIVNAGTLSLTGSLDTTGSLVVGGGTFSYDAAGTNSQSVAGLTVNRGGSTVSNTVATDTLNLGAITRNAGGTVTFGTTTGNITTTTGNTNGIIAPWATVGSGTAQRYAIGSPDGSTPTAITALTGTTATAGTLANLVAGGNFEYSAAATTASTLAAYTLRYSGAATTTTIGAGSPLTLNGLLNAGTGLLTVAGSNATTSVLTVPSAGELVLNTGSNGITVTAPIGGSGSLTKTGSGTLTLSSPNSNYSGGLNLSQGTINFSGNSAASGGNITAGPTGSGPLTIGNGMTIAWTTSGVGIGANSIVLAGDATFVSTLQRLSIGGPFVLGSQTRTWTLPSSVSAANAVAMAGSGNTGVRFAQVSGGPALSVDSGILRLIGSGSWAGVGFTNAISFTGNSGFALANNAITSFSASNQLGTGATAASVTVEQGGYLNLSSGTTSQSQTVFSLAGAGTVTNLSTAAGNATLTISGNASRTFSGVITNGAGLNAATGISALGVVAVTKSGAGTQIFSGTNAYTGNTTVSAGTLLLDGGGSLASGSAVNVSAGTFGGNGTVGGAVAVLAGATLQAGVSLADTATLTLGGNLTTGANSFIAIGLGAGASTHDVLACNPSATTTFQTTQKFAFLDQGAVAGTTYLSIITGVSPSLDVASWTVSNVDWTGTFTNNAGNIDFALTAIPEPATWLLVGIGITFLLYRKRGNRFER